MKLVPFNTRSSTVRTDLTNALRNTRTLSARRTTGLLAIVCCLVVLAPAAPSRADDAAKPTDVVKVPVGVAYIPDVPYCVLDPKTKAVLELDIAYPSKGSGPFPTLVYFHGGGWVMGSRKKMTPYLLQAAQNGYVAVAVTYRLAPAHPYPAAVEDAKCAVRWLRANAKTYKIDTERIGAVGYSAGGQLACLLGSTDDKQFLGAADNADFSGRVQVVVAWYGITDLESLAETKNVLLSYSLKQYLSGPHNKGMDVWKKASPIGYASKEAAPTMLIHGDNDNLVPVTQSRRYAEQLKKMGAKVTLLEVAKADHNFAGPEEQEAIEKMLRFLDGHLKPRAELAPKK
jgi:acetyl esterase/lipase